MAAALFGRLALVGGDDAPEEVSVRSAGLLAGGYASPPEVVTTMAEFGIDLSGHCSTQISPELVAASDVVLAMAPPPRPRGRAARSRGVGPNLHPEGVRAAGRHGGSARAGRGARRLARPPPSRAPAHRPRGQFRRRRRGRPHRPAPGRVPDNGARARHSGRPGRLVAVGAPRRSGRCPGERPRGPAGRRPRTGGPGDLAGLGSRRPRRQRPHRGLRQRGAESRRRAGPAPPRTAKTTPRLGRGGRRRAVGGGVRRRASPWASSHASHGMADVDQAKAHLSASDVVDRSATDPLRGRGRSSSTPPTASCTRPCWPRSTSSP